MATFRKRQLKSGVVYDIQVKFKEPNTNQTIVKITVWHPEYKMTDKQAERECALIAQKFENDVKQLYTGSLADVPDYNITVGQMADKWLERVHKDFSIAYYERGIKTIEWIKRYIGGYKIREVTPYVIQNFYDKLDREQRVIYTVTAKPALREAIDNFGHTRRELSMDYGVNVASLVIALQGKQIGMEFARSISSALGTKPEKLFYIQKRNSLMPQKRLQRSNAPRGASLLWRSDSGLWTITTLRQILFLTVKSRNAISSILTTNRQKVFESLRDTILNRRIIDPSNSNNNIADGMSQSEKEEIRKAAIQSLSYDHGDKVTTSKIVW